MSARSLPVDLHQLTPGEFNQAYGTSLTNSDFYRMRAGVERHSRILLLSATLSSIEWIGDNAAGAVITAIHLIFEGGSGSAALLLTNAAGTVTDTLTLNNSFSLTGLEEAGLIVTVTSSDRTGYLLILGYVPGDLPS